MNTNVSPAYEREYREWVEQGSFERVYGGATEDLPEAVKKQHPGLVAMGLHTMATCYYRRGAVALLNEKAQGWQDIQAGYWAAVYALRFEHKATSLPAWSDCRSFHDDRKIETAMTMGLARLFGQDTDEASLESVLGDDFDPATILGARVTSGRTILQSVFDPQFPCTYAALLRDRGECCQKRQAWPKRPTEICPFGVLDIEAMLRFPEQASFAYPSSIGFNPTEDALLLEAIIAYHCWYD